MRAIAAMLHRIFRLLCKLRLQQVQFFMNINHFHWKSFVGK